MLCKSLYLDCKLVDNLLQTVTEVLAKQVVKDVLQAIESKVIK